MAQKERYIFKIIVAGDGFVGKTSLIYRLVHDKFIAEYLLTLGANFALWEYTKDNASITLQLWDVAGQQYFRQVIPAYYENAHGAVLVFSLVDPNSLMNLAIWAREIRKVAGDIPMIVIGNKYDLPRNIGELTIKEFLNDIGIKSYFETSAKTGENVREAFTQLAELVYKNMSEKKITKTLK
ncbi:MAG: Rab family GTPase [Candidatus Korarchaeota archaeon]